jgi:hypothetical protein
MVLFFIADLALSLAFKVSTWCLGKTYDGIAYLVSRKSNKSNDDTEFVLISRDDYQCRQKRPVNHEPVNHEPVNHEPEPESSVPSSSK